MNEAAADKLLTSENGSSQPRAAYISAPFSVDTRAVRHALESKGVVCFSPDQLDLPGQNLSQILREGMERADLVIAIVDPTSASNNVFYELGFAQAMNKPTLVLAMGDVPTSTWIASGIPYFRFDPENPSAMEYGITQVLKAPHPSCDKPPAQAKRTHPLGKRADELLAELKAAGEAIREADLERIIVQAIRESGVRTVQASGTKDQGVDAAVWSDDLQPWVGNPMPVEVKKELRGMSDVNAAAAHLVRALPGASNAWGLLVYFRASVNVSTALGVANIIHLPAEDLLDSLRNTSFGELIRQLRNARVHGSK